MTLREYGIVIAAAQRRQKDEMQRARVINQEMAHLVAYAFHDPKNIPDLSREQKTATTPEESSAALRAAFGNSMRGG